ncbi:MAG: DUF5615 family PIN-like protein [Anaerolineae bacterium]|nr:DUF5615 family PIN-like protein [Anaerolineae bacterium]
MAKTNDLNAQQKEEIRFHLDENVNPAVADQLRNHNIDVTTSQEVALLGVPDLSHLEFARREGRVIFTEDADFVIFASHSTDHLGIVYSPKSKRRSVGEIVNGLLVIHGAMAPEEMAGYTMYLSDALS